MESCNAAISIGGKIKRSAIVELAAALSHDSAMIDWTDFLENGELVDHILGKVAAKDHLYFCNNDQPWGQYESTEAFCCQNGLIYVLLVWTTPDGIKCARMRSLKISDKGGRRWNRLAELAWIRRNTFSSSTE